MADRQVREQAREVIPAIMLLGVGALLIAQVFFGGIADRVLAWSDHFGNTPTGGTSFGGGAIGVGNTRGGGGRFTPTPPTSPGNTGGGSSGAS